MKCENGPCRHEITYAGSGRKPRYCSDACKQSDYRFRRDQRERAAAREARIRADEQYVRSIEHVITLELDALPQNSRLSTTQRKELASRLARKVIGVQQRLLS